MSELIITSSGIQDLAHLKIPFGSILSATNNFDDKNVVLRGVYEKKYRGELMWSGELIRISARRFNKDQDEMFRTEVLMLSSLKHQNLISLLGFCDEYGEKIIITRREIKGSLVNYLSDATLLTWVQRLKISVGVAHALRYIHYDEPRDFSVIHRNISSHTLQLDANCEPKLSNFEISVKIGASQRHRSFHTSRVWQREGYTDPTYIETKSVNHKTDMYSFGIVLFELLCGRKSIIVDEQDNKYLDQVAIFHYQEKILNDIIDPDLWKQMDPQSFNIVAETAYNFLNKEGAQRPNIDEIITRLEEALKLQLKREHEFRELSRVSAEPDDTSSTHQKGKSLEHLKIGLSEIELATENFGEKYCIGSGGFGKVYKAQLEHYDGSNSYSTEGDNKCDLPKKRSTVAIKHIYNPKGKQGFGIEIETLTSCQHDNIISLLGFCDEGPDHMILIYEYASRGSLEDCMESNDKMTNLTWEAKIADFGLSKIHPKSQEASTLNTFTVAGTNMYLDPEYEKSGKLNKKADIYSFGVVLFEILTGTLAYDRNYTKVNKKGIAPIARQHYESGTLMEIVDPMIKEERDGQLFSLTKGPNKDSLDIFSRIAYRCLAETQAQRPAIDDVIQELRKVLQAEEKTQKENFKMSLEDINLATQNLSDDNLIGRGGFGNLYKGEVAQADGRTSIAAKRLDRALFGVGETRFFRELDIPLKYKHENVIGLVGYCDEEVDKIIVHEFASKGSLDEHLNDASLTWLLRLKICMDIASGLNFLHATDVNQEVLIHRDIKSSNILLFDGWKAKITGFGLSMVCPLNQNIRYVIDDAVGTIGYTDPLCSKTRFLTKESDVFSLGAVLFEILCGKLSSVELDDEYLYLPFLAKYRYQVGKLDELVFEGIKEQIEPNSLKVFARIAYQCLHHRRERRPTAGEVVLQIKRAFEIQEDYEIWEPKLPRDYKKIIQMSKCPEDYSAKKKMEIYSNFSEGILLHQDKVAMSSFSYPSCFVLDLICFEELNLHIISCGLLLSHDSSGDRSEMVSATTFSFTNSGPYNSQSLPESRSNANLVRIGAGRVNSARVYVSLGWDSPFKKKFGLGLVQLIIHAKKIIFHVLVARYLHVLVLSLPQHF
nr:protein kinase-like domain, phloem protein 2-like protein [Tanacetum cinerariifolium]